MQGLMSVANEVVTVSRSVLHLEAMMTRTQEAISADSAFLLLMNKYVNNFFVYHVCVCVLYYD